MSDLSQRNPTGRFTGLGALYARCRPGYPDRAVDFILSRCGLGPGSLLIDVGCGTGISSRLFAGRGVSVIGVEPNADMRAQAEAEPLRASVPPPVYRQGRAEDTGLLGESADAVLAAQAFHWFDHEGALRESHRILRPAGWCVLMANERDTSDLFTAAYGQVIRALPDAPAVEDPRRRVGEVLLRSPLFRDGETVVFANEQRLDEDQLIGRSFSMSYAPREPEEAERFANELRALFGRHQQNGTVVVRYATSVSLARRGPQLAVDAPL